MIIEALLSRVVTVIIIIIIILLCMYMNRGEDRSQKRSNQSAWKSAKKWCRGKWSEKRGSSVEIPFVLVAFSAAFVRAKHPTVTAEPIPNRDSCRVFSCICSRKTPYGPRIMCRIPMDTIKHKLRVKYKRTFRRLWLDLTPKIKGCGFILVQSPFYESVLLYTHTYVDLG